MSTKTIAQKLQIKPEMTLWSSHADRVGLIGPLPENVQVVDTIDGAASALVFADDEQSLRELLAQHGEKLSQPSVLWVAYPKGNRTDINRDTLWPILTTYGLRPNSQIAIDDTWSALRFRALKPGEEPFTGGR
jgi:hypothetical protein